MLSSQKQKIFLFFLQIGEDFARKTEFQNRKLSGLAKLDDKVTVLKNDLYETRLWTEANLVQKKEIDEIKKIIFAQTNMISSQKEEIQTLQQNLFQIYNILKEENQSSWVWSESTTKATILSGTLSSKFTVRIKKDETQEGEQTGCFI